MLPSPTGALVVIPSRLATGETFTIKVKLRGEVRKVPSAGGWCDIKPRLRSAFNLNVPRQIQFMDDCLPEWQGRLVVEAEGALDGPGELVFDGREQGTFPGDSRPIRCFDGFRWTQRGFGFIRLTDPDSGFEVWSNACHVTEAPPSERIFWGDPHWQTYFSDGIRCPEELYAFARDEGFLDFGALADHMEAVTDRQWDYFQAVSDDFEEPGRFATLIGQEWTNHNQEVGAPGHRNVYYRSSGGPVLRSTDPECNTLEKLWRQLDALPHLDPIAIPHHSANVVMGVDWEQGWNPRYEKAVEIYSVWGSSEKHADEGNPRPIYACKGEMKGRHVIDALKRGYRMGFVGGGDIHDGRPGDDLHNESYPPRDFRSHPEGFTAALTPRLTREGIYDAIKSQRTYASTRSRTYLEVKHPDAERLTVTAAAPEGIREAAVVRNGEDVEHLKPDGNPRILESETGICPLGPEEFCYVRVTTQSGEMAWWSPWWG